MKNTSALTSARYELLTATDVGVSLPTELTLIEALDAAIGYKAPAWLYSDTSDIPEIPVPVGPLPAGKLSREGFKVALCAGHSRAGDSGAVAINGLSEHGFYSPVILSRVASDLRALGYEVIVIDSYAGSSYGSAMRWLAAELKHLDVDLAYEFHFNAASPKASGFEALYWHKTKVSDKVARAMQSTQSRDYSEMVDRGVEPLGDQAHERGTLFCSLPHCPSVILEPFFGTNAREVSEYMSDGGQDRFVNMLSSGIDAGALTLIAS